MNNKKEQVGVAIIGCGYWGMNYVRVFDQLPESEVVTVCDPRIERLNEVRKRFPNVTLTTNVEAALRLNGVDVAVICTNAQTHFDVARRCLLAGKPILVEKPLTTTSEDSKELISIAEDKQLALMVGHTFIYNSGVQKVKEYVDADEAEDVYYLYSSRTNLGPIRNDVNALWDLAPHDISIFNYLLDAPPIWVSAVGSRVLKSDREDVGFISLGYQDNVIGNIHVSWANPNKVRELVVVGSNKRIVFDDTEAVERVKVYEKGVKRTKQEADSFGEFHFEIQDGDIVSPRIEVSEPLKTQCRHFLDCVQTGNRPMTDGQAGLEVVQVMKAIDRSIAQNGAPVFIQSLQEEVPLSNSSEVQETI